MAMIKCSECGHDISNKAAACPFCGAPVEQEMVAVHIWRMKKLGYCGVTGQVLIDGVRVGSAGNGVDYTVKVTPGSHQITVESEVRGAWASARSNSENFYADKRTVDVEIRAGMDAVGFLSSGTGSLKPIVN